MGFLSTHRRKLVIGALVGLFASVGVAVAVVLLTTTLKGNTAFADVTASLEVQSAAVTAETGGVTCTAAKLGGDEVSVSPKVKRVVSGQQSSTIPGTCDVSVTVKNTGSEALTLNNFAFTQGPPAGWSLPQSSFSGPVNLAPGQQGTLKATVVASDNAAEGPFEYKINYRPSSSAPVS